MTICQRWVNNLSMITNITVLLFNCSSLIFLLFILLSVSIHDISSYLVFNVYLLYFSFVFFFLINRFDTKNRLENDFSALHLTRTKEYGFKCFPLITSGVLINSISIVCWNLLCQFLYHLFWSSCSGMIFWTSYSFCCWIHPKIIIFLLTINYLCLIPCPLTWYYSSK